MDREDDRHLLRQGGQLRHRLSEQRPVDQGRAVEGDEGVGARLEAQLGGRARRPDPLLQRHQGVDHRVADHVHALVGDPLAAQVGDRLGAVEEEPLGKAVGDDPVDLLGHGAIEAAQPRLDMGDRNLHLDRGQHGGQGRVDVAGDHHQVGFLVGQDRLQPFHRPRRLHRVAAGADLEHVVGGGHAELLQEDLGHQPVVVLTGVDDRVAAPGVTRPQGADHRRRLDEVGPGADDVEDPHRGASVLTPIAGTPSEGRCLLQYRARCRR